MGVAGVMGLVGALGVSAGAAMGGFGTDVLDMHKFVSSTMSWCSTQQWWGSNTFLEVSQIVTFNIAQSGVCWHAYASLWLHVLLENASRCSLTCSLGVLFFIFQWGSPNATKVGRAFQVETAHQHQQACSGDTAEPSTGLCGCT